MRALLSLPEHQGLLAEATALARLGWQLVVTPNLIDLLHRDGIPTESVADFVGVDDSYPFPPTLHPKMEAALTLDESFRIDLVYDVTYPLTGGNDVGGHTLLALGLKGNRIVVSSPDDMRCVIAELESDPDHQSIPSELMAGLADKTLSKIINHYLSLSRAHDGSVDGIVGKREFMLANGENPYQQPATLFKSDDLDELALPKFRVLSPDPPCFTNLADLDAILQCLCLCSEAFRLKFDKVPWITVTAKHGNPCGLAFHWESPAVSLHAALFGNPSAIWGGECIVNFPVDRGLANILFQSAERDQLLGSPYWMLDVIAAPDIDRESAEILGKRRVRRLLENPALSHPTLSDYPWQYRNVRGGFLRQPPHHYVLDFAGLVGAAQSVDDTLVASLIVAWSVSFSSFHGGNEIALAKDNRLIGVGGGPSTVDAARVAVMRARENHGLTEGSVFAADAFFPFTDAPAVLREAGCVGGIVPLGGDNFDLVRSFFAESGMTALYLPSEIRGFCRH